MNIMRKERELADYIDLLIVSSKKYYLQFIFSIIVLAIVWSILLVFLNANFNTDINNTRYRMDHCINVVKNVSNVDICKQGELKDNSTEVPIYFIAYKQDKEVVIETNRYLSTTLKQRIEKAFNKQNTVMKAECTNDKFCTGVKILRSKQEEVFWSITKKEYEKLKGRYDTYFVLSR